MSVRLYYPGEIMLPPLPPGCTTIYDAAMSLTGREPRDPVIGFGGDHPPEWRQLRIWLTVHQETYDLFSELLTGLRDGKLQPSLRVHVEATDELDPFRTLIAETDAAAIAASRKRTAETGASPDILTAFEAMSLLAVGKAVTYLSRHDLFNCKQSTWGYQWFESRPPRRELINLANVLDARAARGPTRKTVPPSPYPWKPQDLMAVAGPSCLWEPDLNIGQIAPHPVFPSPLTGPEGPATLRRIVWNIRRARGYPLTVAALAELIRAHMRQDAETEDQLRKARQQVLDAVRDRGLHAWGLPSDNGSRRAIGNLPQQIPTQFFHNDRNTLQFDGVAALDPEQPGTSRMTGPGVHSWCDVYFRRDEVLALRDGGGAGQPVKCLDALQPTDSSRPPMQSQARPRRLPPGPRPKLRESITQRMITDYAENPDQLVRDTLDNLKNQYDAARETVKRARGIALAHLSRNSDGTLNTNK